VKRKTALAEFKAFRDFLADRLTKRWGGRIDAMHPSPAETRLASLASSFTESVGSMPKPRDQFYELADVLIDRNPGIGNDSSRLTEPQRVLAALARFDVELENGGLLQFFWNCPEWVEHVRVALVLIGAFELGEAFGKAVEQLAGGH
jgi:hypothetical protein